MDAFHCALLTDGRASCVKVEGDPADRRLEAEFYVTAGSFRTLISAAGRSSCRR